MIRRVSITHSLLLHFVQEAYKVQWKYLHHFIIVSNCDKSLTDTQGADRRHNMKGLKALCTAGFVVVVEPCGGAKT